MGYKIELPRQLHGPLLWSPAWERAVVISDGVGIITLGEPGVAPQIEKEWARRIDPDRLVVIGNGAKSACAR